MPEYQEGEGARELRIGVMASVSQQQEGSRIWALKRQWTALAKGGQGLRWGLCLGRRLV